MGQQDSARVFYRDAIASMRTPATRACLVASCRVQRAADELRSAAERGDDSAIESAMGDLTVAMTVFRNLRAHAKREVEHLMAGGDG